jgi:ribonuclease VapC
MDICLETSAIVAIILGEKEGPALLSQLAESGARNCPANCALEAVIVLVRKQKMTTSQARELVFKLLEDFDVSVSSFDEGALSHAIEGYSKFGQGRGLPPALLNFGDCLSYGTAKAASGKLLYTGGDFGATDLA